MFNKKESKPLWDTHRDTKSGTVRFTRHHSSKDRLRIIHQTEGTMEGIEVEEEKIQILTGS